jgi:hypothetical protein
MLRYLLLSAGAVAMLSAAASPALAESSPAAAVPALTGSSSAAIVHLIFVVNGKKSDSGAELPAAGSAPPTYDKKTIKSSYAKTTDVLDGIVFKRSATSVDTVATGHAATATGVVATASATVSSFHGTLTSPLGTLVTVTTGKISSHSAFSQTKAGVRTAKGGTSLVSVHIDAPVLGINKTYTGTPKVNEVLFHNSDNSVIIYLNRQITTTTAGKVSGLTVDAIDVQINKYKLAGNTISGSITVGPTTAK